MPPINEKPAGQPDSADSLPQSPLEGHKPSFDAKTYLERTLQRRPGELLKVIRIPHTNSFRINWYTPVPSPTANIPGLTVMHIRESKFLHCTMSPDGQPIITYPAKQ